MSSENLNPGAFSHATDLKNRILFTILLLIVYRVGTYVPLSGIDPIALKESASISDCQNEFGFCCSIRAPKNDMTFGDKSCEISGENLHA